MKAKNKSVCDEMEMGLILGRYLLGRGLENEIALRYVNAVNCLRIEDLSSHNKLTGFTLSFPFAIAIVDAGLAVCEPQHPLRQRILLMHAILETKPRFSALYLPAHFSSMQKFGIFCTLIKTAVFSALGFLLYKLLVKK